MRFFNVVRRKHACTLAIPEVAALVEDHLREILKAKNNLDTFTGKFKAAAGPDNAELHSSIMSPARAAPKHSLTSQVSSQTREPCQGIRSFVRGAG